MGKGANIGYLPNGGLFTVVLLATFEDALDPDLLDELAGVYYVPADNARSAAQTAADIMRHELIEDGERPLEVKVSAVFAGRHDPLLVNPEDDETRGYDLEDTPGGLLQVH